MPPPGLPSAGSRPAEAVQPRHWRRPIFVLGLVGLNVTSPGSESLSDRFPARGRYASARLPGRGPPDPNGSGSSPAAPSQLILAQVRISTIFRDTSLASPGSESLSDRFPACGRCASARLPGRGPPDPSGSGPSPAAPSRAHPGSDQDFYYFPRHFLNGSRPAAAARPGSVRVAARSRCAAPARF